MRERSVPTGYCSYQAGADDERILGTKCRVYSPETAAKTEYLVDRRGPTYLIDPKGKFVAINGLEVSGEAIAARAALR